MIIQYSGGWGIRTDLRSSHLRHRVRPCLKMKLRMQTDMRTVGTALQHNSHFRLLSGSNRDAGKLLTMKAVSTGQSVSKDPSSQILYALWNYIKMTLGQVLNWAVLQRHLKSLTSSLLVYLHHHSQLHSNIKLYRHTNFALRTLSLVPQKLLIRSKETSFTMLRDIKGEKPTIYQIKSLIKLGFTFIKKIHLL